MTTWLDTSAWCQSCEVAGRVGIVVYGGRSDVVLRCAMGHQLAKLTPEDVDDVRSQLVGSNAMAVLTAMLLARAPRRPLTAEQAYWHACSGTPVEP